MAPHASPGSYGAPAHASPSTFAAPPQYATASSYAELAADTVQLSHGAVGTTASAAAPEFRAPSFAHPAERHFAYEPELISAAAREAVVEHALKTPAASVLSRATAPATPTASIRSQATAPAAAAPTPVLTAPPTLHTPPAPTLPAAPGFATTASRTEVPVFRSEDPVEQAYASALVPFGPLEGHQSQTPFPTTAALAAAAQNAPSSAQVQSVTDAMGNELKSLRRMLETQLAQLAWNDLTRRAPIHTEILRELTEIGITPDLADHLIRQLPDDTDLTFARRFAIAGLSQYLQVTGERWLDNGGRVAFIGATGVGKTTTLAKFAVRWVLRHGPRNIALVAADAVRIGAQDQLQSLAQLLGVPVYTPDKFDHLPTLLDGLSERLVLIDTPGSSIRDAQAISRLAVLASCASKLETALVLAASTQAGALEEAVKRFAPTNPSCCILTKIDEAVSLGGALSVLIRARLPISYVSEGQRVPEDLRPARALELVSSAVRLAKTSGAAADEDLLRRRYGKTAHALT
jgi:flagellar biosynthesis protein FlhF